MWRRLWDFVSDPPATGTVPYIYNTISIHRMKITQTELSIKGTERSYRNKRAMKTST
jgi:hypothetical protein